jgi:hypothetical protein
MRYPIRAMGVTIWTISITPIMRTIAVIRRIAVPIPIADLLSASSTLRVDRRYKLRLGTR